MRRVLALVFLTMLLYAVSPAQEPGSTGQPKPSPAVLQVQARFKEANSLYEARRYGEALAVLEQIPGMAGLKELPPRWRAEALYAIGSLHARFGYEQKALSSLREATAVDPSEYRKFLKDDDLAVLRSNSQFHQLIADARRRSGFVPLPWDRSENTAPFPLVFDSSELSQLVEMRREFHIDQATANAKDDLQRLRTLTLWTSRQWEHSSTQEASHTDPLTILREAKQGGKFICMNYAVVLVGAAQAYAMPARLLALLPRDIEERADAHSVAEVWLKQYGKWAIADAQNGIVPTLDGRPLSAIELQDAIARGKRVECGTAANCAEWTDWIAEYLYYFKIGHNQKRFSSAGQNPELVLAPKGAPHLRRYNGQEDIALQKASYTSNPSVFYAPPQ